MSESTDLKFNRFEFQLISDSNDLTFNLFQIELIWDSTDLRFNWFEIQLIWNSIDLGFNWFEIHLIWDSIDLRLNYWFQLQLIWDSSGLKVNWFETWFHIQVESLKTKLFCEISFKNGASKLKKKKLFCKTSFKNRASKLENKAFLRDFLQKWSFEALKQSFSARRDTSFKNGASKLKTKLFCETSFKNGASGTNRVTSDHKGDTVTLCDRRGTPSTLGHLRPYFFMCFHGSKRGNGIGSQATNVPMPRVPRKTTRRPAWKRSKSRGFAASPTPNDMTTCLETFEKERFCSFPYRHGETTGKLETRDETRGRSKTSISCETSSNFDTFDTLSNRLECHKVPRLPRKTTGRPAWKRSKSRGFAASPIDTELTAPRLEANKGPAPRPPDYKREPFATYSGKNFSFYQSLPLKTSKYVEPMSSMPFQLLPSLQSRLPPAWPQKIQKTGAPLGTKHSARAKMAVKPSPLLNVISRHSPIPRYFLRKSWTNTWGWLYIYM